MLDTRYWIPPSADKPRYLAGVVKINDFGGFHCQTLGVELGDKKKQKWRNI
jgi:hypothetical protein